LLFNDLICENASLAWLGFAYALSLPVEHRPSVQLWFYSSTVKLGQ